MKFGFVVLIGRSNVGKSTLMNTLVGTKIAATSFRAQMTRQTIHGVINTEEGQAVLVDTPGIFKDRKSSLTAKLTNTAKAAVEGVDVLVYVVDPTREIGDEERAAYGMVRHLDMPKILIINKSDLPERERKHEEEYMHWAKDFDEVIHLSALRASHIDPLKRKIMEFLPEGEPMYDDLLTNIDQKFWAAEIIREKVFSVFDKEVPYSITVEIEDIEETQTKAGEPLVRIMARILTNQERYKKIIIGKGGLKLKEIGTMARRELEAAGNQKVYLELEVEVDKHWVNRM